MNGTWGGLGVAEARVDAARLALGRAVTDEWRSTAARGFADRLAEHQAACATAHHLLALVGAAVRHHEAALALARSGLAPGPVSALLPPAGGGGPGAGWWPGRAGVSGAAR